MNEVFVRLIDGKEVEWRDRAHFFAITARMMRRILVDAARARRYQKRGGGAPVVSLDEALTLSPERGRDIVALDDAQIAEEALFVPLNEEQRAELESTYEALAG